IFGHYVIEGLKGSADANANGRVTVAELGHYVQDKVRAWAQANRGVEQKPILLGSRGQAETVEVAQIDKTHTEQPADDAPGKKFEYPEKLEAEWKAWEKLTKLVPHPTAYAPQLWRRYQEMLVRYEEIVCFGTANDKADDLAGRLAGLRKQIEQQ